MGKAGGSSRGREGRKEVRTGGGGTRGSVQPSGWGAESQQQTGWDPSAEAAEASARVGQRSVAHGSHRRLSDGGVAQAGPEYGR